MKNNNMDIKFTDIPMGAWDSDGRWQPNLNLKMSVAEQAKHNLVGGHFFMRDRQHALSYVILKGGGLKK